MDHIQIALGDDHRLFRKGMVALIEKLPAYTVLFEADNGKDLIDKLAINIAPHILLLDLNMPKMDGLSTAAWLRKNHSKIKTIVLSMHNDAGRVLQMISLGIKGYLLKDAQPAEFEEALDTVSKGQDYFPAFVVKHLVGTLNPLVFPENELTSRELEFIKLAACDITYTEIASKMCVSKRTVDGYRDQIFEKLNIKSRVGLVIFALKNKLIEL